jgi:hypothetical protein
VIHDNHLLPLPRSTAVQDQVTFVARSVKVTIVISQTPYVWVAPLPLVKGTAVLANRAYQGKTPHMIRYPLQQVGPRATHDPGRSANPPLKIKDLKDSWREHGSNSPYALNPILRRATWFSCPSHAILCDTFRVLRDGPLFPRILSLVDSLWNCHKNTLWVLYPVWTTTLSWSGSTLKYPAGTRLPEETANSN